MKTNVEIADIIAKHLKGVEDIPGSVFEILQTVNKKLPANRGLAYCIAVAGMGGGPTESAAPFSREFISEHSGWYKQA